jgi:hypothetical protein
MRINKWTVGITAAAALFALAGTANADYFMSQTDVEAGGDWSNSDSWLFSEDGENWAPAGTDVVPGAGDIVYIVANSPISITGAEQAAALEIESGAMLSIDSGSLTMANNGAVLVDGTLTVSGAFYAPSGGTVDVGGLVDIFSGEFYAAATGTVTVNNGGTVELSGSSPLYSASGTTNVSGGGLLKLNGTGADVVMNSAQAVRLLASNSVLWVAASGSLSGSSGSIRCQNAAPIYIGAASGSPTVQLSNSTTIIGSATIQKYNTGTADFANVSTGFVIADNGTMQFHSSLGTLTARTNDSSGSANSQFMAKNINGPGVLRFDRPVNTAPARYFYVDGSSTLTVNVQFAGSGINSTYGTVNGSQSAHFLTNTPTY